MGVTSLEAFESWRICWIMVNPLDHVGSKAGVSFLLVEQT